MRIVRIIIVVGALVLLGLFWRHVLAITGVLHGDRPVNIPHDREPPPPLDLEPPKANWTDTEEYARTHPTLPP